MATLETQGISLYYETHGDRGRPPVIMIAGLGGAGSTWGAQVERFAEHYLIVLPDHRGTGRTTPAKDGYSIAQHAADMAAVLDHLDLGPAHIVGTSTGGAIAQVMALEYAPLVRSVVMTSAFARMDAYMLREFTVRRKILAEWDPHTIYGAYALFLFSPLYASRHPERIAVWIDRAARGEFDREIALKRTDMVMGYDNFARLSAIRQPTLAVCGDHDFCTPLHISEEIVREIPGAQLEVLAGGGHQIHFEQEELYFETVKRFIDLH